MKKFSISRWFSIFSCIGVIGLVFSVTYGQTEEQLDIFAYLPIIQRESSPPVPPINVPAPATASATQTATSTLHPIVTASQTPTLTIEPTTTGPETQEPSITPSLTPLPSFTPTLSPTQTPTVVPSPTATFNPNQDFTTKLVSIGLGQEETNHNSLMSAISADGRFVAYQSFASNIVPNDTNHSSDIFVYDLQTDETVRVSVDSNGVEGNDNSFQPAISGDGRYVAFQSFASNLIISDTNPTADIFLHDRVLGATTKVQNHHGDDQRFMASSPSISANGQNITFLSVASSHAYNDLSGLFKLIINAEDVDDLPDSLSEMAPFHSVGKNLEPILNPSVSLDGQHIVFESINNLDPSISFHDPLHKRIFYQDNRFNKIFVSSLLDRYPKSVSIPSYDIDSLATTGYLIIPAANNHSFNPAISADGSIVAFESLATNLVPNYANNSPGIFTHDVTTGQTEFISAGTEPSVSADGQLVTYHLNGQIYTHDRQENRTWPVSVNNDGDLAIGKSIHAKISANGKFVSFASNSTNLSAEGANENWDIYIHNQTDQFLPNPEETVTPEPTPTIDLTTTPTLLPSPTLTPTPHATQSSLLKCTVKIQGTLIEGQRMLEITGDRFVNNNVNLGVYKIDIQDITNGEVIASGIPVGALGNYSESHGCTNGNAGLVQLDLADSSASNYINPAYAAGLPGDIQIVVTHENNSVDDQYVLSAQSATATAQPTVTPVPRLDLTPTSTPIANEPQSLLGNVRALYTEYVPQEGATVYLIEQPQNGVTAMVVDQTTTGELGNYAFYDVPLLTNGNTYTILACFTLNNTTRNIGTYVSILPDPTKAVAKLNIFMEASETGCGD